VGSLLCVAIILFSSTLFPDDVKPPQRMLQFLIMAWLFCQTATPVYLSFHLGVDWGLYRLSTWLLMFMVIYWLLASRIYREVLFERFTDAQWWAILMFVWFNWRALCSVFTEIEIYSLQFLLKGVFFGYVVVLAVFATIRDRASVKKMALMISIGVVISCLIGIVEWRLHSNVFARFMPATADNADNQWFKPHL